MRLPEDHTIDPAMLAELEAIDATLRGEAVDPAHAELAELALMLASERPELTETAAASLDGALARRFAPLSAGPQAGGSASAGSAGGAGRRGAGGPRGWLRRPALGVGLGGLAACAIVAVIVLGGGSSTSPTLNNFSAETSSSASATTAAPGALAGGSRGAAGSAATSEVPAAPAKRAPASASGSSVTHGPANPSKSAAAQSATSTSSSEIPSIAPLAPSGSSGGSTESLIPTQTPNGRRTTQSAQLQLMTAPDRIDQVSQEVFTVVGSQSGIVKSSTVTSGSGESGYANFQLSIPSANLSATIDALSLLRYAHVVSRTDQSQDVNNQYLSEVRALQDAQALHTALLKQLANAYLQTQIDSLNAQIKDVEATIAGDQTALSSLNQRISYSPLQVQITTGAVLTPPPASGSSGGFTLHKAWHDAVRVLAVVAGAGLIALAALLPVAALVALVACGLWLLRRYRREAALRSA